MSRARHLLGRLGFVLVVAYAVLSATFFFIALAPDPNEVFVAAAAAMGGGDSEAAVDAYRAARNRDSPLLVRYGRWLLAYSTFQWGQSRTLGEPVLALIGNRGWNTLVYAIPGLTVAAVGGLLTGMWNAIRPQSLAARMVATGAVVVAALPSYWLGYLLAILAFMHLGLSNFFIWADGSPFRPENLPRMAMAAVTIAAALLAVQTRYVRSGTAEFVRTPAAKLVRMKGGHDWHVARHALALLGASFLTLFLTETLTVLFLGIYVIESVFDIPGFGALSLYAIRQRDIPLILGTTFVPVVLGLLGTFLQDLVETALDPRLDD